MRLKIRKMRVSAPANVTMAVLPLQVLSQEEELLFIAQGFTDDLTIHFSKFHVLSVISSYSTRHLKYPEDHIAIENMGMDYFVTGSIRALGSSIRIGVQLIYATNGTVIFARQYDVEREDITQALDMVIMQLANALQQQINHDLLSHVNHEQKTAYKAYYLWLKGMSELKKGAHEHDLKAREYFEEALKVSPQYARAYTGISLSYFNEWSCRLWERWDISREGAQKYALKALELDENDYLALMVLGRTYLFTEEFEIAEHCLRKSVDLNPNDADNLVQVAFWMCYLGLADEALQLYNRAVQLNPYHPDSYCVMGAFIHFEAGLYQQSLDFINKVPQGSSYVDAHAYVAATYFHLEDLDSAREHWNIYLKIFEERIYKGTENLHEEAFRWHVTVNPYKGETRLRPFWEFISIDAALTVVPSSSALPVAKAVFKNAGEYWQVTFMGQTATLKDVKGYSDVARLLQEPEKAFHCSELMGSVLHDSTRITLLDDKARAQYQARIRELQAEIAEAENMNNPGMSAQLEEEYDHLVAHLSSSLGLNGKHRAVATQAEKARSAVTWRIRNAIRKIEKVHPPLSKHLSNSIRTGTFCSYKPEVPVSWEL